MIAIYKAKEMKSYSLRFNMYLQKKLVKSLLVNDWGNLLITYCKQYLLMCKKTHLSYFKALFAKIKDIKPKTKKFLKQKVHKYYCIENKESWSLLNISQKAVFNDQSNSNKSTQLSYL